MGLFKRVKRQATFADAREIIQLGTETKAMWQGQLQALQAMQDEHERTVEERSGPDFEPIAGVDVQAYGEILRDMEASGASKSDEVLQRHGLAPDTWEQVWKEWSARTLRNNAVGEAINRAYRGV
jgi:hypothetical protein